MTDWLATCRLCVADIHEALERLPTRVEREPVLQLGKGGDDTTAIDQAAEDAVVARLSELGEDFVLVSEELGERMFGAGGRRHVVVDPIDGSVNAKRGIPFFSFSLAVADGPTMGDVFFGYVYDFGTGEEWTAGRDQGAFLGGAPLGAVGPKDPIEIVAFEGTTTKSVTQRIPGMIGIADRVRVMGSLALALPSRRWTRGCGLLSQGDPLRGHRGRPAAAARARDRDRALRRSAVRLCATRSRHTLAGSGGCVARACGRSRRSTSLGTLAS